MPGGDGTGPRGFGPMTGRAAGFCAGFGAPGYATFGTGRGYGAWGRGRGGGGRGYRNWYHATGLTGWQRAAGYVPTWGGPVAYGRTYYAPPPVPPISRQQEMDALKAQAEYLEDALEGVRIQLKELEERQASKQGA